MEATTDKNEEVKKVIGHILAIVIGVSALKIIVSGREGLSKAITTGVSDGIEKGLRNSIRR